MGTLQYLGAALQGRGHQACAGTARYTLAVHVSTNMQRVDGQESSRQDKSCNANDVASLSVSVSLH